MIGDKSAGPALVEALSAFCNSVLAGRCPREVSPFFFGGRLLALNKEGGGVRPIAIGLTLRRLASKLACDVAIPTCAPLLSPIQLGVGVAGGLEGPSTRPAALYSH